MEELYGICCKTGRRLYVTVQCRRRDLHGLGYRNHSYTRLPYEKVERFAQKITTYAVLRYTLLPLMAVFFLGNPMCYTFGRFCEEKYKPAYYDAAVSFVHPITGLFPHANAGELFVWLGIAQGLQQAGLSTGGLAVRYFIVGLIVILIRGLLTERIYAGMVKNK